MQMMKIRQSGNEGGQFKTEQVIKARRHGTCKLLHRTTCVNFGTAEMFLFSVFMVMIVISNCV